MSTNKRCLCGNNSVCYQVKGITKNRGRWFYTCGTKRYNYFAWDDSALPFTENPYQSYSTPSQLDLERARARKFSIMSNRRKEQTNTTISKETVGFSIINQNQIVIRCNNETIEAAIADLPNISYDPVLSQYIIPANLKAYQHAYHSIPTDLNNAEVAMDPIMPNVLQILKLMPTKKEEDDVQVRYSTFGENNFYGLANEMDREAVKRGLELKGRILLSNQTGLNGIRVAFSLINLYQEEFPVLLLCPRPMMLTWRDRIMSYFGFSKNQVVVGDRPFQKESKRKRTKLKEVAMDTDLEFLIVDVEKACNSNITDLGFELVLMDNSDTFCFKMHERVGRLSTMVGAHKRVILLSEMSYRALPFELSVQINTLQPELFPNFKAFAIRYCDAKHEVLGWNYQGRSNQEEFKFVMNKMIWHAPDIKETGISLTAIYRHKMICNILVKHRESFAGNLEKLMMDGYFEEDEHLKQEMIDKMDEDTGKAKIEFISHYIKYIFEGIWRQNIAILYRHKKVLQGMKKVLKSVNVGYEMIDKQEDVKRKMKHFMSVKTTRLVLVDMNLENLKMLHSVDLVVMTEMPLKKHVDRIESVFETERKWPMTLRYLVAPGSLDDYLWKTIFGSVSTI